MKSEKIEFRSLLRALRIRKGPTWKQPVMADALGFSHRLYVAWENGESVPSTKKLRRIADYFKLNREDEEELYRAAAQAPPRKHNFPFLQNPFFTGRETHLERLSKLLQESGTVEITQSVSISGLGGIGKTQLALEYAYRHYPKAYLTVLWANAADATTLQASYDSIAHLLELPEKDEHEADRRVQAVKRWLEEHTSWLLIMDNADDLQLARFYFPIKHHGHILLTTRSPIIGNIAKRIEIGAMEPEEGLLFLLRRSHVLADGATPDTVAADIRETILRLVELLGGHPLALDQAGAYIEETGVSFTDYINFYHEQRRLLLDRRGSLEGEYSEHPETVATTFELSLKKAHERHPMAADILHFCAFLHPDAIPEELFQLDDRFNLDIPAFREGIIALRRYSLVKRNMQEQTFSVHRLVQAVLIDTMSLDLEHQWRGRVAQAASAVFSGVEFKEWNERLLSYIFDWLTSTEGELLGIANYFHQVGFYQRDQGRYSLAEKLLVRVLSIYEQCAEDIYIASALHDLAVLYIEQNRYEQAETLLVRALSIREEFLGAGHPTVAGSLHMLAVLYHEQSKYGQAELLYRRALEIFEKHLGAEHPDTAPPLYRLSVLLHDQVKHEQAEALYRQALSIHEQHYGTMHPSAGQTKKAYADFLHSIGRDAEAEELKMNYGPSE